MKSVKGGDNVVQGKTDSTAMYNKAMKTAPTLPDDIVPYKNNEEVTIDFARSKFNFASIVWQLSAP